MPPTADRPLTLLSVFRDIGRFAYNHGLMVALLIFPYAAVVVAARLAASAWGAEQPAWDWLHFSLLLAMYPLYMGRLIKYLAWLIQPAEAPRELDINAQEWRRLFLVNLLITLAVYCGLALLVLPGLYLAARFAFAEFVALLRREGPVNSIELSWTETSTQAWLLFLGTLVVFACRISLMLLLNVEPEAPLMLRLGLGLLDELISILYSLILTVLFFHIYCSDRSTSDPRT